MNSAKLLRLAILSVFLVFNQNLLSQKHRILLDEVYTDWDNISGIVDSGDTVSGTDFIQLKATNFENYLFLLLELDEEINLQNDNLIRLFIDSDNDANTGLDVNGIGADIKYTFGQRRGTFYYDGSSTTIYHNDIGLVSLPTVTSNIFEIQFNKNSVVAGEPLFPSNTIKISIENLVANGDIIPNNTEVYEFSFSNLEPQHNVSYSIKRMDDDNLRIVSYNVELDQLFDNDKKEAHRRIFQALDPDIIGFQEIYDHTAQQTADLIEEFLPSADGETWYFSKEGPDIIVVSRFPISSSFAIDNNGAFIIDLKQHQYEMLFVNAHTPSGDKNDARQKEIDSFMAFIRDAKMDGGVLTLEKDTPIVIVGDMNLVGYKQQVTTLITGDIVNNDVYGESFLPDWDSTYFADSKPVTTNMPSTFTWYAEGSSFSPGRLDYVVYSNSVMNAENSFVLFTNALPDDSLNAYNLQRNDVTSVADHLPTVVDFAFPPLVSVGNNIELDYDFSLSQNYPNPFNPSTTIKYSVPNNTVIASGAKQSLKIATSSYKTWTPRNDYHVVTLKVYDILGRKVATLINHNQKPGNYEVQFDASDLTSGIYFYKLASGEFQSTKKLILLK